MQPLVVVEFDPADALPLVRMWRASFELGVGVVDPHPIEKQVTYLLEQVVPANRVRVVRENDVIIGFVASTSESISQLYVRVDRIGQGIGRKLLDLAKSESCGSLWLHTFQRNERARRFYERNGFAPIARGFEPFWQLPDVRYRWTGSTNAS